jgi:tetratricopeptide (TPR) repeat protein
MRKAKLTGLRGLYPAYIRGESYIAAGRGQEAAMEFQKVLKHRDIVFADPKGALDHLQRGRAYVALGDRAKAKKRLSGFSYPL